MLHSYVQLNVRDRDLVRLHRGPTGPVEQTKIVPAQGAFGVERRIRGTVLAQLKTMRLVLAAGDSAEIFVVLYLTYNDLMDAKMLMMAVTEALVLRPFLVPLAVRRSLERRPMGGVHRFCLTMATETAIIMLVYLREAIDRRGGLAKITTLDELRET